MKLIGLSQYLGLMLLCAVSLSCHSAGAKTNEDIASLPIVKWRLTENRTLDEAQDLQTVTKFDLKKQYALGYPSSFIISRDSSLYLVDNRTSNVFKVSSDFQTFEPFLKTEKRSSSLRNPLQIKEHNDRFFISDNEGLKVFDKDGNLANHINPYIGISDFVVGNNDDFLVSRSPYNIRNDAPLILRLDSNGKKTDALGDATSVQFDGIENQVFLGSSGKLTVAAYKYKPLVEIYDTKANALLKRIDVKAVIFDELTMLKHNKDFVNPEPGIYKIPTFIAGLKVFGDRLYILLHLPNPEIIVFTLNGEAVQRYRSKDVRAFDYFGFDIRLSNGATQFVVGTVDSSQKPEIVVFEKNN